MADLTPECFIGPMLSAYLDGELPTGEVPVVFAHLDTCEGCRTELHELDAARTAVRSMPVLEPPVLLGVERQVRSRPRRRWRMVTVAAGAAAAIVITVGVVTSDESGPNLDVDTLTERHIARASVEPAFPAIPAINQEVAP